MQFASCGLDKELHLDVIVRFPSMVNSDILETERQLRSLNLPIRRIVYCGRAIISGEPELSNTETKLKGKHNL